MQNYGLVILSQRINIGIILPFDPTPNVLAYEYIYLLLLFYFFYANRILEEELLRDYFKCRQATLSKIALLSKFSKGQCGNTFSELKCAFHCSFDYFSYIGSGFYTSHRPQLCFKVNNTPSYIKESYLQHFNKNP